MRALLVVNPHATTTSAAVSRVIHSALSHVTELTTVETTTGGHAEHLAYEAALDGVDVVIAFGGDGTVNEVANGIVRSGRNTALAALPGGNANVFVRAFGYSRDAVESTDKLISALTAESFQQINIGRVNWADQQRHFLFNAGLGLDASVLAKMEQRRARGKRVTNIGYAHLTAKEIVGAWRKTETYISVSHTSVSGQSGSAHGLPAAFILNLSPWSYLGNKALNPVPSADVQSQLDLYAPQAMSIHAMWQVARGSLTGIAPERLSSIVWEPHLNELHFSSDHDVPVQMDGEFLGQATQITVTHVPDGLRVIL